MSKTYSFKELKGLLPMIASAGHPILLRGRHGIGKSAFVYQMAGQMAEILDVDDEFLEEDKNGNKRMKVVERRTSQMTEGDIIGIPDKEWMDELGIDEKVTRFIPPKFIKQACKEPVILFLDEVDRSTIGVAQTVFQMTDSHKMGDNFFHPQTRIIAAVNSGGSWGQQYTVREMDPAELDRWTVFDVDPSKEDWLERGQTEGNFHPSILSFLRQAKGNEVEHTGQFDGSTTHPSRRSWTRFNEALLQGLESMEGTLKENINIFRALASGYVSQRVANSWANYVEEDFKDRLKPEELIDGGEWEKATQLPQHKVVDLIYDLNHSTDYFESQMSQKQIYNLRKFFAGITGEAQLLLLKEMAHDKNEFKNYICLGWVYILKDEDADDDETYYVVPPAVYSDDPEEEEMFRDIEEIFLKHKGDDPAVDADPENLSDVRLEVIDKYGEDGYNRWYSEVWKEKYSFQDRMYDIIVGEDEELIKRTEELSRDVDEDDEEEDSE